MGRRTPIDDYLMSILFTIESCRHALFLFSESVEKIEKRTLDKNVLWSKVDWDDVDRASWLIIFSKDSLILRIMYLFDSDPRTFSFKQLKLLVEKNHPAYFMQLNESLMRISNKYSTVIEKIKNYRNTAVAHRDREEIEENLIEDKEILNMPIINLLDDCEAIINQLFSMK